jgi:hypothetical protein
MHIVVLLQHVGWFGGKRIDFHLWEFKDQIPELTWVVINVGMLTEYFLLT